MGQTIGPLVTSRWVTCAVRVCCRYTRTRKPSKALVRLTKVAVNQYFPGWFMFKFYPHIQSGARNFFFVMELTHDLEKVDKAIAQKVLQDNSYWAHPENILVAMLGDSQEVIRRRAVLSVRSARQRYDETPHPRQFRPPQLNFKAQFYHTMINWEEVEVT